jgi:Putative beta-barrel porin 2
MKKIVASVGLVALGASGLYSAPIPGLTEEGGKNWTASLTLRGFYDDNFNTVRSGPDKQDAFGFEVSPSIAAGFRFSPQTSLSLSYVYSFKYYDHKPLESSTKYDQSHIFNASLDHAFSERYKLNAHESFVIGQEPDVLRTGASMETFQRLSGDNIRNDAGFNFDAQVTRLFGLGLGYDNSFWDYAQHGRFIDDFGNLIPSASGLLDRVENSVNIDSRWMILPETVAIFGYRFRDASYTANEVIGVRNDATLVRSDNRNFREHSLYVGAEHTFRPDLTGAARVGASYVDYYNDPSGSGSGWTPYAVANLRYTYLPDSFLEIGLSQDVNATDIALATGTDRFTQSEESTVVYGKVSHHITPQLTGNLLGQFQYSSVTGIADVTEKDYMVGINLAYQFAPHFSTEIGYNYDRLESDIAGRNFDRNRVYIGVTGSY